ncbi:V/A-type H+-transporting ATPase subunit E [Deinobacterium chartae]|uniref:V/A-type H+-transporting ATPase subunit E n=1 Tax=Deinobacterium chartae TaxID=521158 RepID=A0A841HZH3_9DEIO|nr:V-type ATP synthase subunit E [Deinobacterium chartae]MBB6098266.1 V/A-type H+-transporting ATPase subunit E [Deinobacterium chartae]
MSQLSAILETEVRSQIEAIRAEAAQRAQSIVHEAQQRAEALVASRKAALEAQLQSGIVRARSAADLESAALRLGGAEANMSKAFAQAEQQLLGLTQSPQYREILVKLILEAKAALGADPEVVEVHPDEVATAQQALLGTGLNIPVQANPAVRSGVRLVARGGRSAIANTLLGRLERTRDALAPQIAQLLSEGSVPAGQ